MRQCEYCGATLDPQEICDCRSGAGEIALRCVAPPVIAENLTAITAYVDDALSRLAALPRDKEGCATAKSIRADLRRRFDALEDQRKAVKTAVMAPYSAAEQVYKEKISAPMTAADKQFKEWIDGYQDEIKQNCRDELQFYFDELCDVLHIDFVTFDQTGVVVDMATANLKDPKKARNAIHDFLNRIGEDRRTISTMEHAEEIMAEYRLSLSLSAAIAAVNDRRQRIRQEAENLQAARQRNDIEGEVRQALYIEAPEIIPAEEQLCTTTVTVTGTIAQLRALKAFLDSNGYTYTEEE